MGQKQAESDLSALIESSQDLIWSVDLEYRLLTFNRALQQDVERHFGAELEVGKRAEDVSPPELAEKWALFYERVLQEGRVRGEITMPDGRYLELELSPIQTAGVTTGIAVIARDVTQWKQAERMLRQTENSLRESEDRYRMALQASLDAININAMGDGTYIEVNEAFLAITGYERSEVIGRSSLELGIWKDEADREKLIEALRLNGSCRDMEIQFRRKNGQLLWGQMSASITEVDGVACVLSVTRDISHAKLAEQEIRHLAFYDMLTGLPNRRLLLDRLQQVLAASTRTVHQSALLLIDLDDFKKINDTLGHPVGDLQLQEVACRLRTCVRGTDTVSRFAGDEFIVLLEHLSEDAEDAASQAQGVAEKILAAIARPFPLHGRDHICTSSIGIVLFGRGRVSADEVLKQADIAKYQAKSAGRNTAQFFSPELQAAVTARAELEAELREAIHEKQFVMHYQPQLNHLEVSGAEALVRWNHPDRGLLLPIDFIGPAEETGLILPLGEWVLVTACEQLAQWAQTPGLAHITIAVNISAKQLHQASFVDDVLRVIEQTGVNPDSLRLELTESIVVENVEDAIAKMVALRARGVKFSLDDFGTGYSSLAYLKRLPLDQLKIDRSFVRDILVDAGSAAIAETIIALGRALGLRVIAEGIETEEQRNFLTRLHCYEFQGYLFSRPLPVAGFEKMVREMESMDRPGNLFG